MIFDNKIDTNLLLMSKFGSNDEINIYDIVSKIPDDVRAEIASNINIVNNGDIIKRKYFSNDYLSYDYEIKSNNGIKTVTISEYFNNIGNNVSPDYLNYSVSICEYEKELSKEIIGTIKYKKNGKFIYVVYGKDIDYNSIFIRKGTKNIGFTMSKKINNDLYNDFKECDINIHDIYIKRKFKH